MPHSQSSSNEDDENNYTLTSRAQGITKCSKTTQTISAVGGATKDKSKKNKSKDKEAKEDTTYDEIANNDLNTFINQLIQTGSSSGLTMTENDIIIVDQQFIPSSPQQQPTQQGEQGQENKPSGEKTTLPNNGLGMYSLDFGQGLDGMKIDQPVTVQVTNGALPSIVTYDTSLVDYLLCDMTAQDMILPVGNRRVPNLEPETVNEEIHNTNAKLAELCDDNMLPIAAASSSEEEMPLRRIPTILGNGPSTILSLPTEKLSFLLLELLKHLNGLNSINSKNSKEEEEEKPLLGQSSNRSKPNYKD